MKRYIDPVDFGGAPFKNQDFVDFFQENWFNILKPNFADLRAGAREGLIIGGVEATANGSNFNTSSGVVFIDGEFYNLPAKTNIPNPSYIVPASDVTTQRVFRDLASKNIIVEKVATTQSAIPASGQYITINRLGNDFGWKNYTPTYTKANGWLESTTSPLQYRKNNDGTVSWRGTMIYNSGSATSDLFISNLGPDFPADMVPGDANPAGGTGAPHIGTAWVTAGSFAGLQPILATGSFSSGIMQIGVAGIKAGDTSATNRSVYIDLTYSTVDY